VETFRDRGLRFEAEVLESLRSRCVLRVQGLRLPSSILDALHLHGRARLGETHKVRSGLLGGVVVLSKGVLGVACVTFPRDSGFGGRHSVFFSSRAFHP
jgi:hypothetical protein